MANPFITPRDAALALLNAYSPDGGFRLSRKAGSFLGETVVDDMPLSEKQAAWLLTLLDKASLSALAEGGGQ